MAPLPANRWSGGGPVSQNLLCVLPQREQQSMVPGATRVKLGGGLTAPVRPRPLAAPASRAQHTPSTHHFHAPTVLHRSMSNLATLPPPRPTRRLDASSPRPTSP